MVSNTTSLGFSFEDAFDNAEALSPLCDPTFKVDVVRIPPDLHPTKFQREVFHHPWIDILLCAQLRDNMLRAEGAYDDKKLFSDYCGHFWNRSCCLG